MNPGALACLLKLEKPEHVKKSEEEYVIISGYYQPYWTGIFKQKEDFYTLTKNTRKYMPHLLSTDSFKPVTSPGQTDGLSFVPSSHNPDVTLCNYLTTWNTAVYNIVVVTHFITVQNLSVKSRVGKIPLHTKTRRPLLFVGNWALFSVQTKQQKWP